MAPGYMGEGGGGGGEGNQAASTQMPVYLVKTMLYSFLNLKKKKTMLELRNVISNSTLTWLIFNNCRKKWGGGH